MPALTNEAGTHWGFISHGGEEMSLQFGSRGP